jgi:hypothetical protein
MVVQLSDYEANRNGRRYTAVEKEAAYLQWKSAGGRSLRKTAAALDISPSTLSNWYHDDGWKKRVVDEDREDIQSMHAGMRMRSVAGMPRNFEVAEEIRDDPTKPGRDRLAALQWLAGVAGVVPVTKSETSFVNASPDEPKPTPDFASMSIQELRDYDLSIRRKNRPT